MYTLTTALSLLLPGPVLPQLEHHAGSLPRKGRREQTASQRRTATDNVFTSERLWIPYNTAEKHCPIRTLCRSLELVYWRCILGIQLYPHFKHHCKCSIKCCFLCCYMVAVASYVSRTSTPHLFKSLTFCFVCVRSSHSGAAVADSLGGPLSCSNPEFAHCNQLNALQAFAWINFIIFFITFVYILFLGFKAARKGDGYTGPLVQV